MFKSNAQMANTVQPASALWKIRAGTRVLATPTSNLPDDSPFAYYVEDINGKTCAVYHEDVVLDTKYLPFST